MALPLWSKVLISLGAIGGVTGAVLGGMFGFAEHSAEKNGTMAPSEKGSFNNDFAAMYLENGELNPEIGITDPLKKKIVASYEEKDGQVLFYWNYDQVHKMTFEEFFNDYYSIYNEPFIFEVKYGSFKFYDEYVLAVKPKQFVDFTKWFIKNVSWGPDLLTLGSFRLVPGVEQNGNAITLGSHSTLHKESSEIKFYPDAFFGSMPIYSILSGQGNSSDALTYSLYNDYQSKKVVDTFLNNIQYETAAMNRNKINHHSFGSLLFTKSLLGKDTFVQDGSSTLTGQKFVAYIPKDSEIVNPTGNEVVFLPYSEGWQEGDSVQNQMLAKLKTNPLTPEWVKSLGMDQFKVYRIFGEQSSKSLKDTKNTQNTSIAFTFEEVDDLTAPIKGVTLDKTEEQDFLTVQNTNVLADAMYKSGAMKLNNFLDFYDMDNYKLHPIYGVKLADGSFSYYASEIEALNANKKATDKDVVPYVATSFDVTKDKTNPYLTVTLKALNIPDSYRKEIFFAKGDAKNAQLFENLKFALGYKGAIDPITIKATTADKNATDENGNPLFGLDARRYQVFNATYPGLIDKIVKKFPSLLHKLTGPHIEKTLNADGYYDYKIVDGDYYGISDADRIGLPLILETLIPNFKGISTDFLRYVATHEYGHHLTLERTQAIDDAQNAVIVGGLSPRSGSTDASFYSAVALRNYLEARTNLDFIRVNAFGEPTPNGTFVKYIFLNQDGSTPIDKNGKPIIESPQEIWGDPNKNDGWKAVVSNHERRFLQNFEGLKEAARLRGVKLRDLFIANSFDENSGTLNPSINGPAEVFKPGTIGQWQKVQAYNIMKQFKDGMGNHYQYDLSNPEAPRVKLVEYADKKGEYLGQPANIVTKFLMFNADGTPVVNVPLNVPLTPEQQKYIDDETDTVQSAINKLIILNYYNNGWNTSKSFVGGMPGTTITSSFGQTSLAGQITDYYNRPTNEQEEAKDKGLFNQRPFGTQSYPLDPVADKSKQRGTYHYMALPANTGGRQVQMQMQIMLPISDALANKDTSGGNEYTSLSGYWRVLSFRQPTKVVSDGKETLDFDNTTQLKDYFFPFRDQKYGLGNAPLADNDVNLRNFINNYAKRYPDMLIGTGAHVTNSFGLTWINYFDPSIGLFRWGKGVIDQNGKAVKVNGNNLILWADLYRDINPTDKDHNVALILMDPNDDNFKKFTAPFYGAIPDPKDTKYYTQNYYYLDDKKTTVKDARKVYIFPSFYELIDFTSIDYSKATRIEDSEGNVTYNWDIDYVNTKVDLNKFLKALQKNEPQNEKLALFTSDRQALANEAMKRFIQSGLSGSVVNFKLKDLAKNSAIFSKDYGIPVFSDDFNNYYVESKTKEEILQKQNPLNPYFTLDDVVAGINKSVSELLGGKDVSDVLDSQDMMFLLGSDIYLANNGDVRPNLSTLQFGVWSAGEPSEDAMNYISTRVENQLADKFTDYIYNIAETLTRDFVQVTYVPKTSDFGNLPDYLTNASEAYTTFDYVIDATPLEYLVKRQIDSQIINDGVSSFNMSKYTQHMFDDPQKLAKYTQIIKKYEKLIADGQKKVADAIEAVRTAKTQPEISAASSVAETARTALHQIYMQKEEELKTLRPEAYSISNEDLVNPDLQYRDSSYFGKLIATNNGYFKDRWQKKMIGMELYDDNGNPVIDHTIRTTDFKGNLIDNRPEAFFVSQLKNFGVGQRTVSGIYRNKDIDAIAMYGYISNDMAKKVKYLRFVDISTGEKQLLGINIAKTNNIFYLTHQGDASSKKTIEDFGYTTWISDYALMSKYKDTLLKPKHYYRIDFVDKDGKVVDGFNMNGFDHLSENGKSREQAPVKLLQEEVTDPKTGQKIKTGKVLIHVDFQFNITG